MKWQDVMQSKPHHHAASSEMVGLLREEKRGRSSHFSSDMIRLLLLWLSSSSSPPFKPPEGELCRRRDLLTASLSPFLLFLCAAVSIDAGRDDGRRKMPCGIQQLRCYLSLSFSLVFFLFFFILGSPSSLFKTTRHLKEVSIVRSHPSRAQFCVSSFRFVFFSRFRDLATVLRVFHYIYISEDRKTIHLPLFGE